MEEGARGQPFWHFPVLPMGPEPRDVKPSMLALDKSGIERQAKPSLGARAVTARYATAPDSALLVAANSVSAEIAAHLAGEQSAVNRRDRMTPFASGISVAYGAYRRPDPAPVHILLPGSDISP
jgi:hypothetical protein